MADDGKRPGTFGLSRAIWDHPVFAPEPFSEREAWAWLIGAAAWKATNTRGNTGPVRLERGEFSFSIRFLAERWDWSKSRVDRFLSKLNANGMISGHGRDSQQVYLIRNYNKFQLGSSEAVAKSGTEAGQRRSTEAVRKEEDGAQPDLLSGLAAPDGAPPAPPRKGTRLPADFEVPGEWIDAGAGRRAKAGLPPMDLRPEVENFLTYWPGVAGAKGLKLDWRGTFINGCLRARPPVAPYSRFGVAESAGIEHASEAGWLTRLEIFNGLVAESKPGSWSPKWGPQPGAKGCLVPAEAFRGYEARHGRKAAGGAP
jgi:hypothetical protein